MTEEPSRRAMGAYSRVRQKKALMIGESSKEALSAQDGGRDKNRALSDVGTPPTRQSVHKLTIDKNRHR